MDPLVLAAIIFLAVFIHSIAGFGHGLISMALLPGLMDVRLAVPLISLVGIVIELIVLVRHREAFQLSAVARLSAAAAIGTPLGVAMLESFDQTLILRLLGIVITGYALYALLDFRLPALHNRRWGYGFGLVSGLLSGLYNVGGPPVVIYGTCRRWTPAQFRSNLQGFFIMNSVIVISAHALSQNYTPVVLRDFVITLPAIAVAVVFGALVDKRIDAARFRQIVFLLLAILGVRLIF